MFKHIQRFFLSLRLLLLFLLSGVACTACAQRPLDSLMRAYGLVDVQQVDSAIRVDLRYNTTDNFVGRNLYNGLFKAYLLPHIAQKISKARALLQAEVNPHYTIVIYDAARPLSVQRQMYECVRGTPLKIYVAPPYRGGRHNFGAAVDLSVYDLSAGASLDMGTPFDYFGPEAHVGNEAQLVRQGRISPQAKANRAMLIRLMKRVGLRPYQAEWWHFQEPMPMSRVRSSFRLLDF